jgi:tetratricopeptide (TPR) repeat protein
MRLSSCGHLRFSFRVLSALLAIACFAQANAGADDGSLSVAVEAARKTHDEAQLRSLKTQLEAQVAKDSTDAKSYLDLAKVNSYLLDLYEMRKDKKAAVAAVDKAIELAEHSIQLDDKSADPHSLLADLYGRKISLSIAMFAGPKYGPKVDAENKRAMALDNKNPRVWASLGRQYLMTPKMFGGDVSKAVESFQKSLALDSSQDETWVWLAKAFEKQGDKTKARDAIQHAVALNPGSPWVKFNANSLEK